MNTRALFVLVSFLAACVPTSKTGGKAGNGDNTGDDGSTTTAPVDSDGDGISDDDEATYGTDPMVADSDGDGLLDGDEITLGTDPLTVDTDGDTYSDGDEVTAGTDPLDASSRIYTGYWPYNPDKSTMTDPGWTGHGHAQVGDQVPDMLAVDQFGDTVDLYDFAMQGKPIIMDVSAQWCYYCQKMAQWLSGIDDSSDSSDPWNSRSFKNKAWYTDIPAMVDSGDIYWVTFIEQNSSGGPPSGRTVESWANKFPDDNVAVLADEDESMTTWLNLVGYPTAFAVDENMTITSLDLNDYTAVFQDIDDAYAQ